MRPIARHALSHAHTLIGFVFFHPHGFRAKERLPNLRSALLAASSTYSHDFLCTQEEKVAIKNQESRHRPLVSGYFLNPTFFPETASFQAHPRELDSQSGCFLNPLSCVGKNKSGTNSIMCGQVNPDTSKSDDITKSCPLSDPMEQETNMVAQQQQQSKFAATKAHALKSFYCRGDLGTRVNPDTIGCVWTGEFDFNTLREDGESFESGKKKLQIQKYKVAE